MENKEKIKFLYRALGVFARFLQKTILPVEYHGLEKVLEKERPYILICNHLTGYDPVAIAAAFKDFPIHNLGKKELVEKSKFLAKLFDMIYMIPIARKEADIGAIKKALKVLKNGHVLGIFPEGTRFRGGDMQNPESGIALLAFMSKVPVMPAYIDGKFKLFRKTHVYFMDPIPYEDLIAEGRVENANEIFMERMKAAYREQLSKCTK